jgi:hypothetical protein
MIKALSAAAVAAVVAAGLTLLPAFTPQVEASVPPVLAKADRLDIHRDCAQQAWPNFDASCPPYRRQRIGTASARGERGSRPLGRGPINAAAARFTQPADNPR